LLQLDRFPRVRLGHLPTPLEPLARLSAHLGGPTLWIKRDDCTGLATGGNKTRKLEFLVADALAQGADTLITLGARQSNHARQTAAAAAKLGLKCVLVLHLALTSQHIQANPFQPGGRSREIGIHQIFVQSDRFENLSSAIALEGRDAHL